MGLFTSIMLGLAVSVHLVVGKKPWEILGVNENATVEQIKRAYKEMALKLHPDKVGGKATPAQVLKATKDFQALNEAYGRMINNHNQQWQGSFERQQDDEWIRRFQERCKEETKKAREAFEREQEEFQKAWERQQELDKEFRKQMEEINKRAEQQEEERRRQEKADNARIKMEEQEKRERYKKTAKSLFGAAVAYGGLIGGALIGKKLMRGSTPIESGESLTQLQPPMIQREDNTIQYVLFVIIGLVLLMGCGVGIYIEWRKRKAQRMRDRNAIGV